MITGEIIVDVHCDVYIFMPKPFLHIFERQTVLKQSCTVSKPKRVEIEAGTELVYHSTGILHDTWLNKAYILIYINKVNNFVVFVVAPLLVVMYNSIVLLIPFDDIYTI